MHRAFLRAPGLGISPSTLLWPCHASPIPPIKRVHSMLWLVTQLATPRPPRSAVVGQMAVLIASMDTIGMRHRWARVRVRVRVGVSLTSVLIASMYTIGMRHRWALGGIHPAFTLAHAISHAISDGL